VGGSGARYPTCSQNAHTLILHQPCYAGGGWEYSVADQEPQDPNEPRAILTQSKALHGLAAVSGTGLGADLVYFATPHPFEELEKTAFLLPFMAVFGQGRCHAGCKGATGDLAVEVASFSQSGFMLANRLLDEFASIEGKLQFPQIQNTTGPALACEANSLPLTVFVLVRDPSGTYLFFLHYIGALSS